MTARRMRFNEILVLYAYIHVVICSQNNIDYLRTCESGLDNYYRIRAESKPLGQQVFRRCAFAYQIAAAMGTHSFSNINIFTRHD